MRQIKLETSVVRMLSIGFALAVGSGAPWVCGLGNPGSGRALAQEAEWIWSAEQRKDHIPQRSACHFRKEFMARNPQGGQIEIRADDSYELWVNGRRVGQRDGSTSLDRYDIGRYLQRGRNVVAVAVLNRRGSTSPGGS